MPSNYGGGEDSWESLGHQGGQTSKSWGNSTCILVGRTDAEAEVPVLWSSGENSWLTGKVPDAGKNWRQKEKRTSEGEMAGWHHRCNEYELGQALGDGEGLGGLVCCSPWGHRESDTTGRVNSSNKHTQLCSNLFCFYICRNKSLVKSNTSEYVLLIQLDFPGLRW